MFHLAFACPLHGIVGSMVHVSSAALAYVLSRLLLYSQEVVNELVVQVVELSLDDAPVLVGELAAIFALQVQVEVAV